MKRKYEDLNLWYLCIEMCGEDVKPSNQRRGPTTFDLRGIL